MPNNHILIVEDEEEIASLIADYLKYEGYKTSWIENGDEVIPFIKEHKPLLILLDILLPKMNGILVCNEIRKFSDIPVIMITAKVEEIDRITGLEIGADDYICKPFSPGEVIARMKAVLRRYIFQSTQQKESSKKEFYLNESNYQIFIYDHAINLTPSEFSILKPMLDKPETVFSRHQLIQNSKKYNHDCYNRTIDFHIKNLRKKFARYLPEQKVIQSVYGVGYKFVIPAL